MGIFSKFARRQSLSALSSLDNSRLSDLGLNRYDLLDAKRISSEKIGSLLDERRAERAHFWLR